LKNKIAKYILIVNPFSGKKNGLQILKKIESIFENHNIELDTFITNKPGHAFQLANQKNLENYKGLLLIGGDGTFHELVNGMMMRDDKLQLPIGIIPGGTGNSFLLDLNITNPTQSIDKILSNKIKKIDILKTEFDNNVKYSINLVGWGMITDVGLTAEKFRWFGYTRYTIAAIVEILFKKPRTANLTIDGKNIDGKFMFVIACNSQHVGKGMKMAPKSKLDDGLMDVIIAEGNIPRLRLLKVLPKLFDGTHIDEPEIKYFQCKKFLLDSKTNDNLNIDGEMIGTSPFSINILKQQIEIFG